MSTTTNYAVNTTDPAGVASCIREAFPFNVTKQRLTGPDGVETPHYGLFRDDNWECVGDAFRASYVPHTVDDIAAMGEAASHAFDTKCRVQTDWKQGHRLIVGPASNAGYGAVGVAGDVVAPRLLLTAGYDGSAFSATLGVFRALCINLEVIDPANVVTTRLRHTRGLRDRMPELVEHFGELASRWPTVLATLRTMQERRVSLDDFITQAYPEACGASRRSQATASRRRAAIGARVSGELRQLGQGIDAATVSVWHAFNGVQGFAQHNQNRKGSPDVVRRALLALDDAAVKRAHDFALSLCA